MHRALRGFPDWIGDSARRLSAIECKIRDSVIRYGSFQEVRLPFVETKDLFARAAGAADAVNKELWSWQSKSGEEDKFVALRPEGTAGAIRCLIEKNLHREFGRYWYCGPMFRYERPQKGRFRQFTQFGVEIVGDDHPNTDVEAIAMAKHALDELGLSEHVKLIINSIGTKESRESYQSSLRQFLSHRESDLSELSLSRLRENRILRILDSKDPKDQRVLSDPQLPRIQDFLDHSSQVHFQKVMEGLKTLEIPFSLDHRLVRGLDYYSHTTFEFLALDPKSGGLGPQQSTVIAGGRYANLIRELGGELDKSGIGWAAGVERLAVLQESLSIALEPGRLDVMLVLLPRKSNHLNESCDLENCALRICNELRRSGLFVDMRLQGSVREQLSLANTFGAKFAVIIGAQEFSKGYVAVKNLDSRVQEEIPLADLVESLKSRVCS